MAARSPARSSAGPDVIVQARPPSRWRRCRPAWSCPGPGGPANSRWSTAWPRRRAASRMIARCSLSSAWPTNSSRRRGRRPPSSPRPSWPGARPALERLGRRASSAVASGLSSSSRIGPSAHRQPLQRLPSAAADTSPSSGSSRTHRGHLVGAVAEVGQRVAHVGAGRRRATAVGPSRAGAGGRLELGHARGADFSSTSRRAAVFLPTPGTRHRASMSSSASTRASGVGTVHRQDGQGQRRARRRGRRAAPRSTSRSSRVRKP